MSKTTSTKSKSGSGGGGAKEANCTHVWVLSSVKGRVSEGTCRKCGISDDFENTISYSAWKSRSGYGKRKGVRRKDEIED